MNLLTLDVECFYSKDYTLSKMTTESYLRDERFKTHLIGFKINDRPAFWVPGHLVPQALAKIDWKNTAMLNHHGHFDGACLAWRYGYVPALYVDTLSMARALFPAESVALSNLPKLLGLPGAKGDFLVNTKDKLELTPWEMKKLGGYCIDDVDLTYAAFQKMKREFPLSELRLIDIIIRLFTQPVLQLNPELLQEAWHDERQATLALFKKAMPHLAKEAALAIEGNDEAAWKKLKTPLSSNDQFAAMLYELGIDPPKKISPAALKSGKVHEETAGDPPEGLITKATKKEKEAYFAETGEPHESEVWAYAFGKTDEGFKELLNHDDPTVPILVEARLGVKSTIKETRAQRFIGIAERGSFPIYLLYYGGHTGRLSGGDKINAQNLNKFCPAPWCDMGKVDLEKAKGLDIVVPSTPECPKCHGTGVSPLRRSIQAPEGHVIVVRDLSGIEARVLAWLVGQDDLVQAFASGEDVYCLTASDIFGRVVTKKNKQERFLGKAVVLGCLGPDTLVLTSLGYKRIVDVEINDTVWDGEEWVTHLGVVSKGEKEILTGYGLTATGDHEILTEHGWRDWSEVLQNPSLFQSAISKANLSSLHGSGELTPDVPLAITPRLSAAADGKASSTGTTSKQVGLLAATPALRSAAQQPESITGAMKPFCRMSPTELDSSIELRLASCGATTPRTNSTLTMAVGASSSTSLGAPTAELSSHISSHCPDGTSPSSNSTGLTITKDTNPATCGSLPADRTATTEEQSRSSNGASTISKQRSQTYDIAYAGPRNRFAVWTEQGPILVHNCGYGLGAWKFQQMLRIGMLGNPSIILGREVADALDVNLHGFLHRNSGKVTDTLPPGISFDTHALHCACADKIIRAFRDNKPKIPAFWDECQKALGAIVRGEEMTLGRNELIRTCPEGLILPNGMKIRYVELEGKQKGRRTEYSVLKNRRKGERGKVYGGLVTENIVQALARIILTDAFVKMRQEGILAVHQVHDEILAVCREEDAERVYTRMGEIMSTPPAWAVGLPLASEGGFSRCYIK